MAGFEGIDKNLLMSIQSNINHTRARKTRAVYSRYDHELGKVVEVERPTAIVNHSMFPYASSVLPAVNLDDPNEVAAAVAQCKAAGVSPEFDKEGRFVITSAKQHGAISKAMGMKTGRDGYGHTDEQGRFQTSGRRRNDETQAGRSKVRSAIKELNAMPDDVPQGAVEQVLAKHNIT